MKKQLLSLCLLLLAVAAAAQARGKNEFTVLQWNIWQEGTVVPGGYDAIISEIVRLKPDFITFSEVRNYHNTRFCDRIVQSLREKGETYYSFCGRYPVVVGVCFYIEAGSVHFYLRPMDGGNHKTFLLVLGYFKIAFACKFHFPFLACEPGRVA